MAISAHNREKMEAIGRHWNNYLMNFLIEKRNALCLVDGAQDNRVILELDVVLALQERVQNIQEEFTSNKRELYYHLIEKHLGEASLEEKLLFTHTLYPHFLIIQNTGQGGIKAESKVKSIQHFRRVTLESNAFPSGVCRKPKFYDTPSKWFNPSFFVLKMLREIAERDDITNLQVLKDYLLDYVITNCNRNQDRNIATTLLYFTFPDEFDPIITEQARVNLVEGFSNTLVLRNDPEYKKILNGRTPEQLGIDIHSAIRFIRNKIVETRFYQTHGFDQGPDFDFYDEEVLHHWEHKHNNSKPQQAVQEPPASYSPKSKSNMLPLNQIFYGPPGTGKTYNTVNAALEIIGGELSSNEDENRKRYNKLLDEGQIAAVTFHQNYDYTDFIEGIKPTLDDDVSEGIQYALVPGVFRLIATKAETNRLESHQSSPEAAANNALFQAYAEMITEELFDKPSVALPDTKWYIKNIKLKPDDTYGLKISADECSPVSLSLSTATSFYQEYKLGKIKKYRDLPSKNKSIQGHHGNATYYLSLLHSIKAFEQQSSVQFAQTQPRPKKNYVLVIDEINRGNVSAVFGELITLLEENKRLGNREATQVTLPYSKDTFGVPNNLYIIATMNTADRSIAILDTALRRRFHFTEMMPEPSLVPEDCAGINCKELLKAINTRICDLHDREKQIGHSYLMNVKSIQDVATVFKQQILPLLQEYFFDDWEKIYQVLNGSPLIEKIDSGKNQRFEILPYDADEWDDKSSYTRIYASAGRTEERATVE